MPIKKEVKVAIEEGGYNIKNDISEDNEEKLNDREIETCEKPSKKLKL
jgi:hypothetical protein